MILTAFWGWETKRLFWIIFPISRPFPPIFQSKWEAPFILVAFQKSPPIRQTFCEPPPDQLLKTSIVNGGVRKLPERQLIGSMIAAASDIRR